MKARLKGLATAVLLAGAVASAPALAEGTIKIGVITDKTGNAKFYAEPVLQGILLAAKVANANGGVLGRRSSSSSRTTATNPMFRLPRRRS